MLINPTLLHVKTHAGRGRQEPATRVRLTTSDEGYFGDGSGAEDVFDRIDVPVLVQGPEATEWGCIRADHAAMADAGEWDDLLEALRFADQDRTMASGGRRVGHLISEGARARLRAALAVADFAGAEAEARRFRAVHALHVEDYAAAHLLAEALIDLGLARLDPAAGDRPGAAADFAAAEEVLADFDPIEEMSPLLAASRYHLLPGLAGGAGLCRDWYQDWCDLDPEDALAHAAHAAFLLSVSGEDYASFEKAARRAARLTGQITGKAAYAIFHLTAHDRLGSALPSLDLAALAQGLMDFQKATDCQHRANVAADFLCALLKSYRSAGPASVRQTQAVQLALAEVLSHRLREFHLQSWSQGANGIAFALTEVFGPALGKGARIQRAGLGLGARTPRG